MCLLCFFIQSQRPPLSVIFRSTKLPSRKMEMVVHSLCATLFNEEELRGIVNIERGPNHIEVLCVIKTGDHGEPAGKLKILSNGTLEIKCECASNCPKGKFISVVLNHSALLLMVVMTLIGFVCSNK
ncbi:hypothetical protein Vadar_015249 [Vaccinium darrowii]|uniref:Uncharacterized protein n=1 Tax=Vaccinium darrowii TaxID=229202 RepID=A0ACB7Z454_9ERIC|nr:hypothetical protein Vadar_015249 [Vaccinium darrowii]